VSAFIVVFASDQLLSEDAGMLPWLHMNPTTPV
jgi:hypothetical protein